MNPRHALTRPGRGSSGHGKKRGERGMVSVWVSVALVAFIVTIGIGIDFAGHAGAAQHARAVADAAARAGGQHLTLDSGRARPDARACHHAGKVRRRRLSCPICLMVSSEISVPFVRME